MVAMTRDFSLSLQTAIPFEECLSSLKGLLSQEGFQTVAVIPFHREFESKLGLPWHRYAVLVVWSPFLAYQAVLSDWDAGILMPFHFVVAEDGQHTSVAVTNLALFGQLSTKIGIQVLVRDLTSKIRHIFAELSEREKPAPTGAASHTSRTSKEENQ